MTTPQDERGSVDLARSAPPLPPVALRPEAAAAPQPGESVLPAEARRRIEEAEVEAMFDNMPV